MSFWLLGIGFASSGMLLWLAAAAIPIAIHLFLKRRQVTVPWAAIRLLQKVLDRESKRIRFEQWLLLLVRTLILLLFALAIARPLLDSSRNPLTEAAKLWVFVIDTSYTLGYRQNDQTRLQLAKERVAELVAAASPSDMYLLVTLGQPPQAPLRSPSPQKETLLAELRRLQLPDTSTNPEEGLRYTQALLDRIQQSRGAPENIRLVLISDFVGKNWQASFSKQDGNLRSLASEFPLETISVGEANPTNLAIVEMRSNQPYCALHQNVQVAVEVYNYSNQPASQVSVTLTVDDGKVITTEINIPAMSSSLATFEIQPTNIGYATLLATIPPDRLATDNQRQLILQVKNRQRILFVESAPGETKFCRLSLAAEQGSLATRELRTIAMTDLLSTDLSDWETIILNDPEFLDQPQLNYLREFVRRGGGLIVGLGANTNKDLWNQSDEERPLIGFRLLSPSEIDLWEIDPLEYRSPIARPFQNFPEAGLLTSPIFRHWTIEDPSPGLIRDLDFVGSGPFLTRNRVGGGWVLCFLSAPDAGQGSDPNDGTTAWNALATWPSFVPLMQESVQTILNSRLEEHNKYCGQILSGTSTSSSPHTVQIQSPQGTTTGIDAEQLPDGSYGWSFYNTSQAGVYRVLREDDEISPFAVNLRTITSQFASLPVPQLPQTPPKFSEEAVEIPPNQESSGFVVRTLLAALFTLLVIENLLARHFGRNLG